MTEEVGRNELPAEEDFQTPALEPRYDLMVLQSLRRIIRAVDLHSKKLRAETGLTSPQLVCLLTIAESDGLSVSGLSKRVHLSASTLVGILDRLTQRGLIHRERSAEDRRLVLSTITEEGKSVIADSPSPLQDTLADALASLPELEQSTIALSLDRVVNLMEAEHLSAAPMLAPGVIDEQPNGAGKTKEPSDPEQVTS